MATLTHKRGDDLEWVVNLTESLVAADVTTWGIRCQVRQTDDTLVQELTITKTSPASGIFSISATDVQTASWTAGTYNVDIEFVDDNSIVFSTSTFSLTMVDDITHD